MPLSPVCRLRCRVARALLLVGLLANSPLTWAEAVRVAGSDLLQPYVAPVLQMAAGETGDDLKIELTGSIQAARRLQEEQADLAILAVPDGQDLPMGMESMPLAFEVTLVVVSAANQTIEINLPQLSRVFGHNAQPPINTWGDLGMKGGWGTRSINLAAIRQPPSLALEIFKTIVLPNDTLRANVVYYDSSERLTKVLRDDAAALSLTPFVQLDPGLKTLSVSEAQGSFAYPPTPDSIHFGDYPLRLPYYLVYPRAKLSLLKPYLKALLADETAAALEAAGYATPPRPERANRILLIDAR